jgi:hypothetical protein
MLHCDRCPTYNCGYIWNDQRWNPICLYWPAHSVGLVSFHHVSQLLQSSTIWLLLFQTILEDLWVWGLQETNYTSLWSMTWSRHVPNLVFGLSWIAFQTILNVASSHLRWVFSFLSPLPLDLALSMHWFLYLQISLWFSQIWRIDKYKLKDVELTNAIECCVCISILLCSCINFKWGAEF